MATLRHGPPRYIPLVGSEWAYLAAWMDLYSRKIKGWSVANNMEEELVHSALRKAINSNQLAEGTIIHSDRGGQYVGKAFRQTLTDHQFQQSMSRAEDPYDNAFMASCWDRFGSPISRWRMWSSLVVDFGENLTTREV